MKTLVAKTERERPKHPKLTEGIWPIDLEHLDQERIRRSNFPTPSIIRKALKPPLPPLLIARNTFTPLIDARKTGHSIFQRESGHVEIEMIRDVLKGSAKASENREGRVCRERARAEIVPR